MSTNGTGIAKKGVQKRYRFFLEAKTETIRMTFITCLATGEKKSY
jgi:hypothetical protein